MERKIYTSHEKLEYYNSNIIGLSEVNIHWLLVNLEDSQEERISGRWEARNSVMACNLEKNSSNLWQPGGYLQISTARTTHRFLSTGSNMSGLGRLVWTRYQVKHNLTLWVVTAYISCITNSRGVQTNYRQHQRYLDRTRYGRQPRQAMLEYLCIDISQWRKLGDKIVLMIDLNYNIT